MTSSAAIDRNHPAISAGDAIDDEHTRTFALLLDVASDSRFALRGEELQELATAVRLGGTRKARWRGIDLLAAFAPETTMRLRPRRRRRLAGVLGVLAVAFLVLSSGRVLWSFGAAAEAFRQMLETGVAQGAALLQFWITGGGGVLPARHLLSESFADAGALLAWSLVFFTGQWVLSRSAARAEDEERDRGAARLALAMTRASNVINTRTVQDPMAGVDVLTDATAELLRAQQATVATLQLLDGATQRLAESAELLAQGTHAVGKSLGLHTGALQHQISELTQVRASLERISGLALAVEEGGRTQASA